MANQQSFYLEKFEIQLPTMIELEENLKFQKLNRSMEKKFPGFMDLILNQKTQSNFNKNDGSDLLSNDSAGQSTTTDIKRNRSSSNYSGTSNLLLTTTNNNKSIIQAYAKYIKEV